MHYLVLSGLADINAQYVSSEAGEMSVMVHEALSVPFSDPSP